MRTAWLGSLLVSRSLSLFVIGPALLLACGASGGHGAGGSDDAGGATGVTPVVSEDAGAPQGDDDGQGDAGATSPTSPDSGAADAGGTKPGEPDSSTDAGASGARLAIPMYIDPTQSPPLWTEVFDASWAVGLLVVSTDSMGAGTKVDPTYTAAIAQAHAAGELAIGYTYTDSTARALSVVEADVTAWYALYPALDGIFVDEVSDEKSTASSYYVPLYTFIKSAHPTSVVAINPGTMVDEAFMSASDILLSYEDTYANYIDPNENPPNPAWVAKYPASRFWNIVLSADASVEANAITLAKGRNAGWIYVTAEGPDTAYQSIETGSYWTTELADVTAP